MDPAMFHINYERLVEVLITIVIFSFFIERALSVLFESGIFIKRTKGKKGVKETLAIVVSVAVCWVWDFDALTIILVSNDHMTTGGIIITGAIVAGGSKASIALFRDVMGFMSNAEKARIAAKDLNKK
ncbi:MAG: hypothetical protein JKX73_00430 [Flavobacteriales bacterium]|nr:hypothetical protein [Flavobacteriales bacterium]